MTDTTNQTPPVGSGEATEGDTSVKVVSAIGYLGILFLVPFLVHPKNEYAVFHANQGLMLFIALIAVNMLWVIPILGAILVPLGSIGVFVFFVIGVINALNGKMRRLPLIGNFDILKVQAEEVAKAEETTESNPVE